MWWVSRALGVLGRAQVCGHSVALSGMGSGVFSVCVVFILNLSFYPTTSVHPRCAC